MGKSEKNTEVKGRVRQRPKKVRLYFLQMYIPAVVDVSCAINWPTLFCIIYCVCIMYMCVLPSRLFWTPLHAHWCELSALGRGKSGRSNKDLSFVFRHLPPAGVCLVFFMHVAEGFLVFDRSSPSSTLESSVYLLAEQIVFHSYLLIERNAQRASGFKLTTYCCTRRSLIEAMM